MMPTSATRYQPVHIGGFGDSFRDATSPLSSTSSLTASTSSRASTTTRMYPASPMQADVFAEAQPFPFVNTSQDIDQSQQALQPSETTLLYPYHILISRDVPATLRYLLALILDPESFAMSNTAHQLEEQYRDYIADLAIQHNQHQRHKHQHQHARPQLSTGTADSSPPHHSPHPILDDSFARSERQQLPPTTFEDDNNHYEAQVQHAGEALEVAIEASQQEIIRTLLACQTLSDVFAIFSDVLPAFPLVSFEAIPGIPASMYDIIPANARVPEWPTAPFARTTAQYLVQTLMAHLLM
eukprot:m.75489 g.75489  ORF g.75489 m.75489 type:complete len:298 (-) comp13983_c2_seq2:109-1002(-)